MNRAISYVILSVLLLSTSPVFAQQGATPDLRGPMWGEGQMWGYGPHMIIGPVMMLLALAGAVALVLWLVRAFSHGGSHPGQGGSRGQAAQDILAERFARGEIDKTEFEDKRRAIGR